MMRHTDYAVTLAASSASLDTFEAALDRLPEACLLGSDETGCAALVFTVSAAGPLDAVERGMALLREEDVEVPNGASLTVLEHTLEATA